MSESDQVEINKLTIGVKMTIVGVFIVQAYCLCSSIYINTPILEKEYNLKYILNVMGCKIFPYWLGTFLFDYLVFFITMVILVLFVVVF